MKPRKPRPAFLWSDVAALMDGIAKKAREQEVYHRKLALMHESLARDLRAMLKGTLVKT